MAERELYKKVDFREDLKMYFKIAAPYKWIFIALIFVATLNETTGFVEKYLFKIIVDKGSLYFAGSIAREIFVALLVTIAAIFGGMVIFKLINSWVRISMVNKLEVRLIYDLKKKFFDHIIHLSHNFHTTHKTGSMIARLNRGASAIEKMTDFLIFSTTPLVIQLILIGTSLIFLDWLSAVSIGLTALAFIIYGLFIMKLQKQAHIESNDADDIEKGNISDVLTNIDSVKYYGKEDMVKRKYASLATTTKEKRLMFWNYDRLFTSGQVLILSAGTFFIIYFPLMKFLDGQISIGTLTFIYTLFGGLIGNLWNFVHSLRGFYISLGDFDSLIQYGRIKNEITDKNAAEIFEVKKGAVEFDNVSFYYPGREVSAIHNLKLKIKPGEKVALVGHSGSGKTTLVKLLYRFYDVDSGRVLIDGRDLRDVKQVLLRSELSIVPQECILFDDTIYNNIAFSKHGAAREEVTRAIKFAQLDKFIRTLPLKENTIVGERGVKLSGGEKQRVSIARAILANKKILVLDEATSALDSKTEFEIQKDLQKLMEGRTTIIIAHRLSTIMRADKIVVMDKGKIVQIGKHNELIKRRGVYSELWDLQKGGYLQE